MGYAGFRFVAADGQLHYGWVRLRVTSTPRLTGWAYEYAYEATPNTPIEAGAYDVALRGSVNRRNFPSAGGLLHVTAVFENNTPDPLPLDFWVEVEQGGTVYLTARLGSNVLPAGATVSRRYPLRVPADLPQGRHYLTFKVGDYATGEFRTFQRLKIRKAAASVASGDEGEPSTSPSTDGSFAGANAADGILGTHALTAPTPNPTTGRSEFTLAVAEAQAVTVAVYDALGRRVALLHEGTMASGAEHRLAFDGSGLPAGVYVVRAVGEAFADMRVLTLAR